MISMLPKVMPYQKTKLAIVFADICNSTRLFEQYGNVRARELVGLALNNLSVVTSECNGNVVKTIGDEIMCTFPELENALDATSRMPMAIRDDAVLAEVDMKIKVGVHFGEVLSENNDVYGDAVNIAARMVEIARSDQIITTRSTVEQLPNYMNNNSRSLGHMQVRGKREDIEIVELLWQSDSNDLTVMQGQMAPILQAKENRLLLQYDNQEILIDRKKLPLSIGRGEQNDLIVPHQSVSRTHAHIEARQGAFVLIDRSTNGTFIQFDEEDIVFLHRDQFRLRGAGQIMLGQETVDADSPPIRFDCSA